MTEAAPTLPGLERLRTSDATSPRLELLAVAYVAQLEADGQLADPADALVAAMVVDLARALGMSARTGKAAGAAMAGRQLLDAIVDLRDRVRPAGVDEWAQVVEALSADQITA